MPDRWFGYEAADVVILDHRQRDVHRQSLNCTSRGPARKALAEWVRRGGKLDRLRRRQSPDRRRGPRQDAAAARSTSMPLHALRHRGAAGDRAPTATNLARWLAADGHVPCSEERRDHQARAGRRASPSSSANRAKDGDRRRQDCPVVVEASCGLGRVWLTAFDVDAAAVHRLSRTAQKPSGSASTAEVHVRASPAARPAASSRHGVRGETSTSRRPLLGRHAALPGELRERAGRQLRLGGPVHPPLHRHRRPARLFPPQARLQAPGADLGHASRSSS